MFARAITYSHSANMLKAEKKQYLFIQFNQYFMFIFLNMLTHSMAK